MEPRRPLRRIRRRWIAALAVVLAVTALLIHNNETILVNDLPQMVSYRVVDQRSIVVRVVVAPRGWTRVTGVSETPEEIRVRAESLQWPIPLPQTGELQRLDLAVTLSQDLGTRIVRDADGQPVPEKAQP